MMPPAALRTLLLDLGYVIRESKRIEYECVAECDGEQWIGSGLSPEAAFVAAIAQALPSRIGRHLAGLPATTEPVPTDDQRAAESAEFAVAADAAPTAGLVSSTDMLAAAEHDLERDEHDSAPFAIDALAVPDSRATLPAPTPAASDASSRSDALRALGAIRREINDQRSELALCAPRRQRLILTRWIAAARALQDSHPDDDTIHEAVRLIASIATRFSKTWWPGRVTALGLASTPAMVASELGTVTSAADRCTWSDAARDADEALVGVEIEDERAGRDEYGWSDLIDCDPAPETPDTALATVAREIEARSGSLSPGSTDALPHAEELAHWARMLRWLRPHVADAERWAGAVGRCRYWIALHRREFVDADRVLDPAYRPPTSWARVLAPRSPSIRAAAVELPTLPTDIDSDGGALVAWITTVLANPLTDHDEIVDRLRPHSDIVLALDSDAVAAGDRSVRRRVSKVKRKLAEAPRSANDTASAGTHAPVRNAVPVPVDPIRTAVQSRTRGKRALLVTNRDDGDLAARLASDLGFVAVDVRRADPRRLEAAVDAVSVGRFDVVLGVTGFVRHSTDGALKVACDRAEIPYVRVAKGRPGACLRALAREFGIAVGREIDAA